MVQLPYKKNGYIENLKKEKLFRNNVEYKQHQDDKKARLEQEAEFYDKKTKAQKSKVSHIHTLQDIKSSPGWDNDPQLKAAGFV